MAEQHIDLFIIGGGINGCGIAADSAGRGLSVVLCEQDDLANYTSSNSSKLIHGGLRYLENYEFRLVKEALIERDVLLKIAPHLVHPLRFVMPHNRHARPAWMIRLGLYLYDHLNPKQSLAKSSAYKLNANPNNPLQARFKKAFEYSDAKVDDARLVVANALQAKKKGAQILTRHKVIHAIRQQDYWQITVENQFDQTQQQFYAKALVNAAGPWVDRIVQDLNLQTTHHIRLVKGSHIVVPKLYEGNQAYILQNTDKRVIFVIPYCGQFSLIGTTDVDYNAEPANASISPEEQDYLCQAVCHYFTRTITPQDIIWSYAGVRPLQSDEHGDPKKVTRDYTLEVNDVTGKLPLLSVFGGKITTYRKLSEHALLKLGVYFPAMGPAWTDSDPLPGSDFKDYQSFRLALRQTYPWLHTTMLNRLSMAYGTRCYDLLKNVNSVKDLGLHFGADLYEREVKFLLKTEWAKTSDDIIWRRSKLGLFLSASEQTNLQTWLDNQ
ncbi:MAG: glycerol-3-phosphate dehydrogenase [Gammaproteobacteria bacterium]|nr:glycerol-3-phosphate dehydrogenase [Gammaproteobacteria bacterium]